MPAGIVIAFLALLLLRPIAGGTPTQALTYSGFVSDVTANKVSTAAITASGSVSGKLLDGKAYTSQIPTALNDNALPALLLGHKVQVTGTTSSSSPILGLLGWIVPLLVIIGLFVWFGRRSSKQLTGRMGGIMAIGKSKARVYDEDRPDTHFTDIAGYEGSKAEVMEVVDFLKHPARYDRAGAVGPKGVLMIGPPGTGKTLLARAVAGEAGVPFFSLSGSSFVEMFVGVGASRVRDLFADARKRAPSIIFIDEIDAIGGRRGPGGFGSNDEREQTLNQLLSEMDGFEPGARVVVMAATNRAEILDAALLRPGRFDRTVEIPLPNYAERTAILAIHGRGKSLAPDVDLDVVSRGTPGFSGADLANLVNEAAINAVRADRSVLSAADFDAARDRLLIGRRDASSALLPEEKACRGRPRSRARTRGRALRARRSRREGHDPLPRRRSRRDRAAASVRAPSVPREPPDRLTRRAPRRPRRGDHRPRRTVDRLGQRPRGRDRPRDAHGPRVGVLRGGRAHQLRAGGTEPRQSLRRPSLCRGDTALHRPGSSQAAAGGRGHGDHAAARARETLDRVISLLLERETIDGSDLAAIVGAPLALAMNVKHPPVRK